jgi:hypothetical protein
MKPPCDEAEIRSAGTEALCLAEARPWILAATILGSSLAFIDSTVVNVALVGDADLRKFVRGQCCGRAKDDTKSSWAV